MDTSDRIVASPSPATPEAPASPFARRADRIGAFRAMEVGKRAAALEARGADVVRMNLGEPDHGVPPRVADAMARAVRERSAYTPALGLPELRSAIARWHGEAFGVDVSAERVVVTAGASAALLLVAAALIDPGDEILVADPSYPCNRRFVEAFDGVARLVPTDASTRFQLTRASVEAHWSARTRGVMVASPSNPTGTSVPLPELAALCGAVAERGGHRIVDEIYLPLSPSGPPRDAGHDGAPRSVLSVDPGAVSVGSFSKFFALPGWRLGWAVVPEMMVSTLERLAQNFYICPSAPAQRAAVTCFEPDVLALCEVRRAGFVERRDRTLAGLAAGGWHVPVAPDGAFYAWLDVRDVGLPATELCERLLDEAHVALAPGPDFGVRHAESHLRLSFACSDADIDRATARLARWRRERAPAPRQET